MYTIILNQSELNPYNLKRAQFICVETTKNNDSSQTTTFAHALMTGNPRDLVSYRGRHYVVESSLWWNAVELVSSKILYFLCLHCADRE